MRVLLVPCFLTYRNVDLLSHFIARHTGRRKAWSVDTRVRLLLVSELPLLQGFFLFVLNFIRQLNLRKSVCFLVSLKRLET
jgi:DNA polymerase III psi subunit